MILINFATYHSYICPNKSKLNLTIMYAVSYYGSDNIFSLVTNVMISLALFQFLMIVLYHFLTYTCHCDVVNGFQTLKEKIISLHDNLNGIELLDIHENTCEYNKYQD